MNLETRMEKRLERIEARIEVMAVALREVQRVAQSAAAHVALLEGADDPITRIRRCLCGDPARRHGEVDD